MGTSQLLTVGSKVWIEDVKDAWIKATVTKIEGEKVTLEDDNGVEHIVEDATEDKVPLQNPKGRGGVDDMTQLSYLNEPGVLHNLKDRYDLDSIYTYTGSILIAVNPFYPVPQLYGQHMMFSYRERMLGELSPHVYAIAEQAFTQMVNYNRSQSVLISGESGAGKTETSKLIMNYLAFVGGHASQAKEGQKNVEQQVLESNPLLEAFGNAKTVRNNNSSRFGKYMEIQFDNKNRISGAAIRTYLLEKSRVVSVNDPERSYHSFYQLCYGADENERAAFKLKPANDFKYLNGSTCFEIEDMDNAEGYKRTKEAMSVVGIDESDQYSVFKTVAIVLHIGNITFIQNEDDADKCSLADAAKEHLDAAAELLGTESEKLLKALSTRTRQTFDGAITSPLNAAAATQSRDSLAKTIYSKLFDWLVVKINTSIGQDPDSQRVVGVLDIYGFECFSRNDFEQFCINLANEKLQQHFNQQIFKKEQEEYKKEEIEWTYIDFIDNQDILDLIEKKPGGLIDLLDEQCQFPRAKYSDYAQKLYNNFEGKSERFSKPKLVRDGFTLNHYAGNVTYNTENFLEKNKDYVVAEHQSILVESTDAFISAVFKQEEKDESEEPAKEGRKTISAFKFASLGSSFKGQLKGLMAALTQTEPHYIRCIKPNSVNKPGIFEPLSVLHQLRCGGVLEAIRISCAGYPSRSNFYDFVERFGLLQPSLLEEGLEESALCGKLLEYAKLDGYQIGKSKIFLKGGQMAMMDKLRIEKMTEASIIITKFFRGFTAQKKYKKVRNSIITLQAGARGMFGRRIAANKRRNRAATRIQAQYRAHRAYTQYHKEKNAAVKIQSGFRGLKARRRALGLRTEKSVLTLQKNWRGYKERKNYLKHRNAAISIQCGWRSKNARNELKKLKVEARQATSLLKDKKALQNKVKDLEQIVENLQMQKSELRGQLKEVKSQAAEVDVLAAQIAEKDEQLSSLTSELKEEAKSKESLEAKGKDLEAKMVDLEKDRATERAQLEAMKEEIASLKEEVSSKSGALTDAENEMQKLKEHAESLSKSAETVQELTSKLAEVEAMNGALRNKVQELEKRRPSAATNGGQLSSASSPLMVTPESKWSEGSLDSHMSELDKQQRELEVRKHKLIAEKQGAQQDKLLEFLIQNKEYHDGVPVAAYTTFKCLLQWNTFQAERTSIFDKIIQQVGGILEENQENNEVLAQWLTNSVTLLALFRKHVRPPSESSIHTKRARAPSGLFAFRSSMIFSRSPLPDPSTPPNSAQKQVEAKYPALLFKQQLDAFVQKIFSLLRDNVKKDIAPTLNNCIHAPRGRSASTSDRRSKGGAPVLSAHWNTVITIMQKLLQLMKDTYVPKFLVRKLFKQVFAFINVQLFNQLLLRRECCSFSNGEYVKTGLAEVENWIHTSKQDYVGSSIDELKQIRQAVNFLVIHQKPKKSVEEITNDLCPVLSVQQLYRISTMYWDDKYGTETVSSEVLARMKRMMVEDSSNNSSNTSFLLDDDPSVPFSWDQLTADAVEMKLDLNQVDINIFA